MKATPWTAEETQRLVEMVGEMPRKLLIKEFRATARRRGWPVRSDRSIELKVMKMGMTFHLVGDWLTTGGVAEILGLSPAVIESWMQRHPDLNRMMIGRRYYLRRKDLRSWALRYPQAFGGIEKYRLFALLESEELAEAISAEFPHRPNAVPVRCMQTGKVYPSQTAAAKAHHMDRSAVSLATRQGRKSCGRWTFEVAP